MCYLVFLSNLHYPFTYVTLIAFLWIQACLSNVHPSITQHLVHIRHHHLPQVNQSCDGITISPPDILPEALPGQTRHNLVVSHSINNHIQLEQLQRSQLNLQRCSALLLYAARLNLPGQSNRKTDPSKQNDNQKK